MSTWIIVGAVVNVVFLGINIFIFLKLKKASEQMMKMAFPGAKNMNEAVAGMQKMMAGMGRGGGRGGHGTDAQLKAAMDMLQNMQKGGKR